MTSTISTPSASAEHWRQRAACRDEDPELFFPAVDDGPGYERQVAMAKTVCRDCPVRNQCLDEALVHIPDGIAGGMTAGERTAVLRGPVVGLSGDDLARQARTRMDLAEAGAALLASGRSTEAVARICGVSLRTAFRWRARLVAARSPRQVAS
jgi:WhiB family redox-sensing transcriptional regulator